jgi:hypothetical protein
VRVWCSCSDKRGLALPVGATNFRQLKTKLQLFLFLFTPSSFFPTSRFPCVVSALRRRPSVLKVVATMRRQETQVSSAATEVPQHVETFKATSSTRPSISLYVSSENSQIDAMASLDGLSNELLFMVAERLFREMQDRFDDDELPPPTSQTRYSDPPYSTQSQLSKSNGEAVFSQDRSAASVTALKNLASTSRRLRDIAQPALYKGPVLSIGGSCCWNQKSPIYLFARTMLENPQLRSLVMRLRIDMPSSCDESMVSPIGEPLEVCRMAVAFIDTQKGMDHNNRTAWKWQLQHLRAGPFCAVILSLLPKLAELSIFSGSGSDDSIFLTLFGQSNTTFRSIRELSELYHALHSLVKCPGLLHLRRFRTESIRSIARSPLEDITTLTSLHLTPRTFECAEHVKSLNRIRTLRLACNMDHTTPQSRRSIHSIYLLPPPSHFSESFSRLLASLPNLQVLELYAGAGIFERSDHSVPMPRVYRGNQRYTTLVRLCEIAASTLKSLEIPRGWWTLPNIDHIDTCRAVQASPLTLTDPFADKQLGAYTGSTVEFRPFVCLESLVIHSTAIIAKEAYDTRIADPTLTLPSSIKEVTVYGAHDELWTWIGDVLDNRDSHFPHLTIITLLRAEPVPGLSLSRIYSLDTSHEDIWRKIQNSSVALRGDI